MPSQLARAQEKALFLGQGSIFGRFLGPGGSPKMTKNLRGVLSKGVLGAIWYPLWAVQRTFLNFGSIFGRFWSILVPCLVNVGSRPLKSMHRRSVLSIFYFFHVFEICLK